MKTDVKCLPCFVLCKFLKTYLFSSRFNFIVIYQEILRILFLYKATNDCFGLNLGALNENALTFHR